MSLKIVKTEKDIITLEKLASRIWKTYWTKMLTYEQAEYMFNKFQSLNAIEKQISQGHIYKILFYKDECVGYFAVLGKKDHLYLSKIYLDEKFRNKGFGKIMLKDIISISKELNLFKIRLNVNKYNSNTIKAYENWGFKIIESTLIDIGQGFVMDDYVMELGNVNM